MCCAHSIFYNLDRRLLQQNVVPRCARDNLHKNGMYNVGRRLLRQSIKLAYRLLQQKVVPRCARDNLHKNGMYNVGRRLLRQNINLGYRLLQQKVVPRFARDNLHQNNMYNVGRRLLRQNINLAYRLLQQNVVPRFARDNLHKNGMYNVGRRLLRQNIKLAYRLLQQKVVPRFAHDNLHKNGMYNVGRRSLRQCYALFILLLFITNPAQAAQPLRIAVSANFAPTLKKLLPEFNQQTGINTQLISGVSGGLYQQIKHGAPYDIFLSADSLRPQALVADNLVLAHSQKTYALGQLALYSAQKAAQKNNLTLTSLNQHTGNTRLAIANPKTAPYGKAAKQCLIKQGIWQDVKNNLIIGNNINQTFQQVRSQAVPMGIVAYSQLKLNKLNGYLLPHTCYAPIKQQLVILKNSKQINKAQQLSTFLLSLKIQQKIAQFGYLRQGTSHD